MSSNEYRNTRWRKLRLIKLQADPLCEKCSRPGEEIDHIIPVADGGDFFNYDGLQTLCKSCHSIKTSEEKRNKPGKMLTRYDLPGGGRRKKR